MGVAYLEKASLGEASLGEAILVGTYLVAVVVVVVVAVEVVAFLEPLKVEYASTDPQERMSLEVLAGCCCSSSIANPTTTRQLVKFFTQ